MGTLSRPVRVFPLWNHSLFVFFSFLFQFFHYFRHILLHTHCIPNKTLHALNIVLDERIYKLLNFVLQFASEWKARSKEGIKFLCGA